MNHSQIYSILLLKDAYKETLFDETNLNVITTIFIIIGVFLNVLLIFASINKIKQGIFSNIISIAFFDIMNLMLLLPEISYVNIRNWKFTENLCSVYLGIECVINISILYTTIMTNVQVIIGIRAMTNYLKSKYCSNEGLFDSIDEKEQTDEQGYQILGYNSDENIERKSYFEEMYGQKNKFPVLLLLIITLGLSVSIPYFLYAQKDKIAGTNTSICIMEVMNDPIFNSVIAIFVIFIRVFLPTLLLIGTTLVLLIKHLKASHGFFWKQTTIALTFSIILIICSLQRIFGSLLFEIYSTKKIGNSYGINKPFTQFKYPHLDNNLIAILLTLTHYVSSLVRPCTILMIQYCSCCIVRNKVKTAIKKTINKT